MVWGVQHQRAMNPKFHKTLLRKSLTFAYVDIPENNFSK